MSALSGSISIRRYRVMDAPPADFRDAYEQKIRAHALVPIDPQKSQEDRSVGWCCLHDSEDLDLCFDKFWLEDRIVLALRVDVLRPSAQDVKRLLAQRQREEEARRKAALPKAALRALKEQVVAELRKRSSPKTRTTDMVWHTERRKLYFFSQSKGPNEEFTDLFLRTFGIAIDLEGPGVWAMDEAQAQDSVDELKGLRPTAALLGGFIGLRPDTRVPDDLEMTAAT